MQRDLQQEVPELVAEAIGIARIERGERLVRLLQEVRAQRRVGLLAVPRTTVRRAQPLGDAHHRID